MNNEQHNPKDYEDNTCQRCNGEGYYENEPCECEDGMATYDQQADYHYDQKADAADERRKTRLGE